MSLERAKTYIEDLVQMITSTTKTHNGYVEKFLGDGAMVIWGYQLSPSTKCENHAVDAVLTAKDLLRKSKEYNSDRPEFEQIHLRIGIASGDVFSGVFENEDRMLFTSIGGPVNLAARLESAADFDSILVSHDHLKRVEATRPDLVESSKCTFMTLKGVPGQTKACMIRL